MTALVQRLRAKLVPTTATVTGRADLTENLVEIWCSAPTRFEPGQVLAVRVDGHGPAPTGAWRRYTIAETNGHQFRLIIQRNPGGAAEHLINTIGTGAHLSIRGPANPVHPPVGNNPLLVVTDLTGLATVAALTDHARRGEQAAHAAVMVFSTYQKTDSSNIADCLRLTAVDCDVHRHFEDIADWVHCRSGDDRNTPRLLAIGEHKLTAIAKRSALTAGVAPTHIRTRTYWKPGRRGIE